MANLSLFLAEGRAAAGALTFSALGRELVQRCCQFLVGLFKFRVFLRGGHPFEWDRAVEILGDCFRAAFTRLSLSANSRAGHPVFVAPSSSADTTRTPPKRGSTSSTHHPL